MKKELKNPLFAVYCKQRSIEPVYRLPFACGYASLLTCMRLLGNRTITGHELIARQQSLIDQGKVPGDDDGRAHTGIDDVGPLARSLGYHVKRYVFPRSSIKQFQKCLKKAFTRFMPAMVPVKMGDTPDHWVVAFSNPRENGIWIMDPLERETVFEKWSWQDFTRWAGDEDCRGNPCYSAVIIGRRNSLPTPPSSRLFKFINSSPGKVVSRTVASEKDFYAAVLLRALNRSIFLNKANRASSVALHPLFKKNGEFTNVLYDKYRRCPDGLVSGGSTCEEVVALLHEVTKMRRDRVSKYSVLKFCEDLIGLTHLIFL